MRGFRTLNSGGAIKSVGATGATGATGSTGAAGTNGAAGADGFTWSGKIAAAWGDGNPNVMLGMLNAHSVVPANPAPSQITASVARISYFLLPFDLTVNKLRYFSPNAVASTYTVALYRFSDLARLTAQIDFDTPGGNVWAAAGSSLALALSKNVLYFLAVSVKATVGNAGVAGFTLASTASKPATSILPSANPGNLAAGNNYVGGGQLGQFAVTTGTLPNPAATLAIQGSWAGGMPAFFLDNDNS